MLRKGVKLPIELKMVSVVYRFVFISMWFMVRFVVYCCWLSQFLLSFCGSGKIIIFCCLSMIETKPYCPDLSVGFSFKDNGNRSAGVGPILTSEIKHDITCRAAAAEFLQYCWWSWM